MNLLTIGFSSLLGLFAISSIIFTYSLLRFTLLYQGPLLSIQEPFLSQPAQPKTRHEYTYVDDDYPSRLPDFDPGYVQMSVEESVRYSLSDAEAPMEWASTSPPGEGSERLGPDGRLFYLSMFHELHCLRRFDHTLRDPQLTAYPALLAHTQHCLNFLRQCALCQADRTLEPGDFVMRNFTVDRIGATHTCSDWRAVYDRVTYDWSNWEGATSDTS